MKASVQWMQMFGGKGLSGSVDQLVEKIGAQLGAVEGVEVWGPRYEGIVVVKVLSCVKHPNADKLSICLIDDNKTVKGVKRNQAGHVQVVCGAPNVHDGMFAAWIPPGVTVPNTIDKDPFVLGARDIRGELSSGMLASLYELGISDDHSGILDILPAEVGVDLARPGTALKKLYGLDDQVIDIENKMFTHRPDLFGQLGIAREVAGIHHLQFSSPDWYTKVLSYESSSSQHVKSVSIKNDLPKLCPRYMAAVIDNVIVKPSPVSVQVALAKVGIRPINNIVDMTNYMMMLTGQPLHVFDFDKLAIDGNVKLVIRHPKKGEKLSLLDGKDLTPRDEAVLICNQKKPVALGGVMGGNNSEVDEKTKRIVVECANFDMYNIRRTSMEHGIFTDAVARFNKGQSPNQCDLVLAQAVSMVKQVSPGAFPVGRPIDSYPRKHHNSSLAISASFVNTRLGTKLSIKDIRTLLEHTEFEIKTVPADKTRLHVKAPFWRTDIAITEDLVEEVGRLFGYDQVPLELPQRSLAPQSKNKVLDFKHSLRMALSGMGASEVLTYTFVHGNLLKRVGQSPDDAYQLSNAISPDLQYYRLSLLPSLLEKVHVNLKADRVRNEDNEFALFELNPVHAKGFTDEDGLPIEDHRLALVFAAEDKTASRKYEGAAYYAARAYLDELLARFGIDPVYTSAKGHAPKLSISQAAIAPFDKARAAIVTTSEGIFLGEVGEFLTNTHKNLKLPGFVAGFELDTRALQLAARDVAYKPIPRFPKVAQDITLKTPLGVTYRDLYEFLWQNLQLLLPEGSVPILGWPRIYQPDKQSKARNITLRLWVSNHHRTLKAEEINTILDEVASRADEHLNVVRA